MVQDSVFFYVSNICCFKRDYVIASISNLEFHSPIFAVARCNQLLMVHFVSCSGYECIIGLASWILAVILGVVTMTANLIA